mgnify:CR=1 FL=1
MVTILIFESKGTFFKEIVFAVGLGYISVLDKLYFSVAKTGVQLF